MAPYITLIDACSVTVLNATIKSPEELKIYNWQSLIIIIFMIDYSQKGPYLSLLDSGSLWL